MVQLNNGMERFLSVSMCSVCSGIKSAMHNRQITSTHRILPFQHTIKFNYSLVLRFPENTIKQKIHKNEQKKTNVCRYGAMLYTSTVYITCYYYCACEQNTLRELEKALVVLYTTVRCLYSSNMLDFIGFVRVWKSGISFSKSVRNVFYVKCALGYSMNANYMRAKEYIRCVCVCVSIALLLHTMLNNNTEYV